jgi:hypothetical protein
MSFIYSKVPTQWSPNDTYQFSNGMYLKPAGRIAFEDYPVKSSAQYFDITFFVTEGEDTDEHFKRLKQWILFHCFIFNDTHACYFFEDNMISKHEVASYLQTIIDLNSQSTAYPLDYDNIGQQVYWLYKGNVPIISYRQQFEKYLSLSEKEKSLVTNYLLYLNADRVYYQPYELFSLHRKYWQTAKNVVLLEQVIGHAPTCTNKQEMCCSVCRRDHVSYSHRTMSEEEWCKDYLMGIIKNEDTVAEYLKVISVAFGKIRHPTAHSAIAPTAQRMEQLTSLEIYDIDRTIAEFKNDITALENLGILVAEITRYLLLNKLFGLSIFPIPETLKSFHFGNMK